MLNNKFYFKFKMKNPKIYDFFPFTLKKKLQLLFISKIYHFYLFEK